MGKDKEALMNILCKSAVDISQLTARKNLKSDGLELQLLSDFSRIDNSNLLHTLHTSMADVKVVHAPLKEALTEQDVCIDIAYIAKKDYIVFMKTCALAESIGCINGKTIPVVIHAALDIDKDTLLDAAKIIARALRMYTHIEILVENVPGSYGEAVHMGSAYALPYLVKCLRTYASNSRIHLVLDVCHVMMRQRIYDVRGYDCESLECYFKEFSPYLRLVHLSNIRQYGMGKDHGVAFETKDKEQLSNIMDLYTKYANANTLLTIETREDDYYKCINYSTTRENLDLVMNSKERRLII